MSKKLTTLPKIKRGILGNISGISEILGFRSNGVIYVKKKKPKKT